MRDRAAHVSQTVAAVVPVDALGAMIAQSTSAPAVRLSETRPAAIPAMRQAGLCGDYPFAKWLIDPTGEASDRPVWDHHFGWDG